MKQRVLNFLIALDQLLYVLLTLGHGKPDETLSCAAFRTEQKGKILGRIFRPLIDLLFCLVEKDHCFKSYQSEVFRIHLPKGIR